MNLLCFLFLILLIYKNQIIKQPIKSQFLIFIIYLCLYILFYIYVFFLDTDDVTKKKKNQIT